MKLTDLKKDKVVSARVNSKIYDLLADQGVNIQKILDEYLAKYVELEVKPMFKKDHTSE